MDLVEAFGARSAGVSQGLEYMERVESGASGDLVIIDPQVASSGSGAESPQLLIDTAIRQASRGRGAVTCVTASNEVVLVATTRGFLLRYSWDENGNERVTEVEVLASRQQADHRIAALFTDPAAVHVLAAVRASGGGGGGGGGGPAGEVYYLHRRWPRARALAELRGQGALTAVGWAPQQEHPDTLAAPAPGGGRAPSSAAGSVVGESCTGPLLLGTECGSLLELVLDERQKKEAPHKTLIEGAAGRDRRSPAGAGAAAFTSLYQAAAAAAEAVAAAGGGVATAAAAAAAAGGSEVLSAVMSLPLESAGAEADAEAARSLVVSEYHLLLLCGDRLRAVNRVSGRTVAARAFRSPLTQSVTGEPSREIDGLVRDPVVGTVYMAVDEALYEVSLQHEGAGMWRVYLEMQPQRDEVHRARAEAAAAAGDFRTAAVHWAKVSDGRPPFEDVALRLADCGDASALPAFLSTRLATIASPVQHHTTPLGPAPFGFGGADAAASGGGAASAAALLGSSGGAAGGGGGGALGGEIRAQACLLSCWLTELRLDDINRALLEASAAML
ncbi:hypothetical protein GPECTOR_6g836 [Gonium pectorale]|uniref:Pep3/Vps18 beta-propeller domain-containing protein n=1 Tax=Gonium pectorale TaxID=33097 RepID=A0A150GW42_GONPE|nr:hypothetical protein GPECTOR_6g836 [Gonium pectorale]|eukprot:KXZ53918.1 hypothetical protein GPECTOR_6g836 [Gonium pectorale]